MSIHFLSLIGMKFQLLVDDGFNIGLAFAAGFSEALSSSWIGIASLTYFSTWFTILIQEVVWSSNKDGTLTSTLYLLCVLHTFMSETGPKRASLSIHPFAQFSFSSRGNAYFRHKDWFFAPFGGGRAWKNCPTSTNSKLLRSTIWITSDLLIVFQIFARKLARGFPVALH